MNKDELLDLGLTEEAAQTVSDAFAAALEAACAEREEAYAAALREKTVENALRYALRDSYDPALVSGMIDREAVVLGEDGSLSGLEEQVNALREEKPYLFRQEEAGCGITLGAAPTAEVYAGGANLSMREAIEGHLEARRR